MCPQIPTKTKLMLLLMLVLIELLIGLILQQILTFLRLIMLTSLLMKKVKKNLHFQIRNERLSELNQSFQDIWVARFPWGKLIVGLDGKRQKV